MSNLTQAQKDALSKIKAGAAVPIKTGATLRDRGLAVKADRGSSQRGYMALDLTDAGRAALTAA